MGLLIARAELAGGRVRDVRIAGETITEIDDRLRPRPDEDVIDAAGGALLPGLHDHHVHLRALAASAASIDLGPRAVPDAEALRRRLHTAVADLSAGGWLRAIGYHESVAGELDRWRLDDLAPANVPLRVQHRSGILWIFNSAALAWSGLETTEGPGIERDAEGRVTGRLFRRDDIVHRVAPTPTTELGWIGTRADALGVTGLTDATPHGLPQAASRLADQLRAAGVRQRLQLMGPRAMSPPRAPRASLGPVKVVLDDDNLPTPHNLANDVAAAHQDGRPIALHCVTRLQLIVVLAAFDEAGSIDGDRIEHGSVIPAELIDDLKRHRLTIVTQPHFLSERGDEYLGDVDADDMDSLYRCRSLLDAGIEVAAGTDAPFGEFDPWASIAAAVDRRSRTGQVMGPRERLDPADAVALYLGDPEHPARERTISVGRAADLCLLQVPRHGLAASRGEPPVRYTMIAGEPVYEASG